MSTWFERWIWPRKSLSNIEADVHALRMWARGAPTLEDLQAMEERMSDLELQTRADLSAAITGALGAYDAVVAERDALKTERDSLRAALDSADADKAAAISAAVEADDTEDAAFNTSQVDELRRLQPVVAPPADGGDGSGPVPDAGSEPEPA